MLQIETFIKIEVLLYISKVIQMETMTKKNYRKILKENYIHVYSKGKVDVMENLLNKYSGQDLLNIVEKYNEKLSHYTSCF